MQASTSKASSSTGNSPQKPSDLQEVHQLIQHVARSFYETKQVVLLDLMVRGELAIRDEHLATRMGVNIKEMTKAAYPLVQQRLLAIFRRNEVREGATKAVSKTWYYLDLKTFIDVTKWRMYKVRKTIDDKLRNEVKSQGYDCPLCKKAFSTLDVLHLPSDPTQGFRCDVCDTFLTDNASAAESELGKTKIRRLLEQCRHITEGLKKTEQITLPALDVKKWLDLNHPVQESTTITKDDGLKVAQGGAKANVVRVEMANDEDAAAIQAKIEAEAEARRNQNTLPSWIAKSTVSGALTQAGAREAQAELLAQQEAEHKHVHTDASNDGDSALRAYYARLAEQASRPPSVRSTRSGSEDLADSLFDGVSPATATPPSSHDLTYEDDKLFVNGNGKRSRQSPAGPSPAATTAALDLEPTGEGQAELKRPKREPGSPEGLTFTVPGAKSETAAAAAGDDSDDDGDFEEVA